MTAPKMVKLSENRKINKLFLIGNGFDLALGFKTGYNHFLKHYLIDIAMKAYTGEPVQIKNKVVYGFYEDNLIKLGYNSRFDESSDRYFDFLSKKGSYIDIFRWFNKNEQVYLDVSHSDLFKHLMTQNVEGWVDIEAAYYGKLKEFLFSQRQKVDKLNHDFEFLKDNLEAYLQSVNNNDISLRTGGVYNILTQIAESIEKTDIASITKDVEIESDIYYFLNFNYTSYLGKLVRNINEYTSFKGKALINQIHGMLGDNEYPIIFGFGDEMDSDYNKLEKLNDKRAFKNIKSFKYAQNKRLRELLAFINSNDYQVCIYGHSCGLSDRVLLNEIFEHENCKSIKVYHYENPEGENDFLTKTMDISFHFNSNKLMRKKLVEFNKHNKIPQSE